MQGRQQVKPGPAVGKCLKGSSAYTEHGHELPGVIQLLMWALSAVQEFYAASESGFLLIPLWSQPVPDQHAGPPAIPRTLVAKRSWQLSCPKRRGNNQVNSPAIANITQLNQDGGDRRKSEC